MSQEIIQKITQLEEKIDRKFENVDRKLMEHGEKLDEHTDRIDFIARTMNEHSRILECHTVQLDKLAAIVTDHTVRLQRIEEEMVTKDFFTKSLVPIFLLLDRLVAITERHDQEIVMINHGMRRVEHDVATIKPLVGLA